MMSVKSRDFPGSAQIALMLMGMSLENLVKGILISRNPELVKDGIQGEIKSHQIRQLIEEQASFSLNDDEKIFLDKLSDHVVWRARYPIPTAPRKLRYRQAPCTYRGTNFLGFWGPEDWATFIELFKRLDRALFQFVPSS